MAALVFFGLCFGILLAYAVALAWYASWFDRKRLYSTCVHEAGHAVYCRHDMWQKIRVSQVMVESCEKGRVIFYRRRCAPDNEAVADPRIAGAWRLCALDLAGLAADMDLCGLRMAKISYPPPSWTHCSDWQELCRDAFYIKKKSAVCPQWSVCPWPENELAPDDGSSLWTMCGEEICAKFDDDKRRILLLAWRRALWVVRRRDEAVKRLAKKLVSRREVLESEITRIFDETA